MSEGVGPLTCLLERSDNVMNARKWESSVVGLELVELLQFRLPHDTRFDAKCPFGCYYDTGGGKRPLCPEHEAQPLPRISDRKWRLFAAAVWRNRTASQDWGANASLRNSQITKLAEAMADGSPLPADRPRLLNPLDAEREFFPLAPDASLAALGMAGREYEIRREEPLEIACLFRDIVGNPFRPCPRLVCASCNGAGGEWASGGGMLTYGQWLSCRACNGLGVTAAGRFIDKQGYGIAKAAYEERLATGWLDNARLAILADALEDNGCEIIEVLEHLRGPGTHALGCWAIDLILGKE